MHNAELIRMVETLKAKRTIKKDVDIVASTGFSKTVVSNYLSGRIKASDNFLDKFEKVYGVDIFNKNGLSNDIEITTSLHAELGRINEILIRLQATARISTMSVIELRAKVYGRAYSLEATEMEKTIAEEVSRLLDELKKKS